MVKKLHDILEKNVSPKIDKQFSKHEEMLKVTEDFVKSGKLIELSASEILDDTTFQIRSEKVSNEDFENLKASLKANGQQVPILVRKKDNKYQVIGGFNRYQALKELRIPILALYKDVDDETADRISEVENIQRINLSFTDIYNRIKKLKNKGLTNEQISARLNKSKRIIQFYMQIGENSVLSNLVRKQTIGFKEAISLSRLPEKELAKKVKEFEAAPESKEGKKALKKASAIKQKDVIIDKAKNKVKIAIADTYTNKEKIIKRLMDIISDLKNS